MFDVRCQCGGDYRHNPRGGVVFDTMPPAVPVECTMCGKEGHAHETEEPEKHYQHFLMYALHYNPTDFKGYWVLTKWDYKATKILCRYVAETREEVEKNLPNVGLSFIPRGPKDDRCIVGTYI